MPEFKFTTNQIQEVLSDFNPISKFKPNKVLGTDPRGYSYETGVSIDDMNNFQAIIDNAQGVYSADTDHIVGSAVNIKNPTKIVGEKDSRMAGGKYQFTANKRHYG